MRMWRRCNRVAGYLVFGLPVASAIPGLVLCVSRFGIRDTLIEAVPAALWASVPFLVWVLWIVKPPHTVPSRVVMVLSFAVGMVTVFVSPLFFWAGPGLLVLASEAARGMKVLWLGRRAKSSPDLEVNVPRVG